MRTLQWREHVSRRDGTDKLSGLAGIFEMLVMII